MKKTVRSLYGWVALACFLGVLAGCANVPSSDKAFTESEVTQLERNAGFYYENQEWERAQQLYSELTEREPTQPLYWYRLANTYYHASLPQKSVAAYLNVLELQPDHLEARHNLAIAYLRLAMDEWTLISQMDDAELVKSRLAKLLMSIVDELEEE